MMFFTDWEGPWIVTDFAYEIAKHYFKNIKFFERLSQFDDYLYYIEKRKGYNAGDTLKLLAPFIIATGITSEDLKDLAEKTAKFVNSALESMSILQKKYRAIVISTSYNQYLKKTTEMLGIKTAHGTELNIEKYDGLFNKHDEKVARDLIKKISKLPDIKIDFKERKAHSIDSVKFLDDLFFGKSTNEFKRKIKEVMKDIEVVGGIKKLEILKSYDSEKIIAIGDSISDYDMLKYAKNRGIAVSFNGNEYSLKNSNLAIISDSAFSEAGIIDAYLNHGMSGVEKFVNCHNKKDVQSMKELVGKDIVEGIIKSKTRYIWVEDSNLNYVVEKSKEMRRKLRGEAGKLG